MFSFNSFNPDRSLIENQFSFSGNHNEIYSTSSKKVIALPSEIHADLPRLGKLIVNGQSVYESVGFQFASEDEKAGYIFSIIESKCNSTNLAIKAAHLLEQDLAGGALKELTLKKGYSQVDKAGIAYSTHAVMEKQRVDVLNIDKKNFKHIHEAIVQVTNLDNIKQTAFFKIKTVTEGTVQALAEANTKKISCQTHFTQERATLQETRNDIYQGNWQFMGDRTDTETYLAAKSP